MTEQPATLRMRFVPPGAVPVLQTASPAPQVLVILPTRKETEPTTNPMNISNLIESNSEQVLQSHQTSVSRSPSIIIRTPSPTNTPEAQHLQTPPPLYMTTTPPPSFYPTQQQPAFQRQPVFQSPLFSLLHQMATTSSLAKPVQIMDMKRRTHLCVDCGLSFHRQDRLRTHMAVRHSGGTKKSANLRQLYASK
ncbi:hypothetical protein BDR26DRAFT_866937 [Obelidium mucronatum]|nr:hypothetical protein BDR26DRAFT_866937 [Obelidium mucronatum]